jgi:hypothetical protein
MGLEDVVGFVGHDEDCVTVVGMAVVVGGFQ